MLSYMRFVEALAGAAASLETSFENSTAWKCCMRASVHANIPTSRQRCTPVETTDLGGMVEFKFHSHTVVPGVETMAETATRGLPNDLGILSCS